MSKDRFIPYNDFDPFSKAAAVQRAEQADRRMADYEDQGGLAGSALVDDWTSAILDGEMPVPPGVDVDDLRGWIEQGVNTPKTRAAFKAVIAAASEGARVSTERTLGAAHEWMKAFFGDRDSD